MVVFYFLNKTPRKTLPPLLKARKIQAFHEGLDYSSYRQIYHESQRHWLWNQSRFRECKKQSLGLTSFTYLYPWIFFIVNFCFLIQIPSIRLPSRMYCHLPWTCINCEVLHLLYRKRYSDNMQNVFCLEIKWTSYLLCKGDLICTIKKQKQNWWGKVQVLIDRRALNFTKELLFRDSIVVSVSAIWETALIKNWQKRLTYVILTTLEPPLKKK